MDNSQGCDSHCNSLRLGTIPIGMGHHEYNISKRSKDANTCLPIFEIHEAGGVRQHVVPTNSQSGKCSPTPYTNGEFEAGESK